MVRTLGTAALVTAALLSPAAAQQRPAQSKEPVETRLQRFEDKEEIQSLLLDYGRFLDSRDFESYASLFAKDSEWVGGSARLGPANIQAFMEKTWAPGRTGRTTITCS